MMHDAVQFKKSMIYCIYSINIEGIMQINQIKTPIFAGYLLSQESKDMLIDKFTPKYNKTFAHHVTTSFGKDSTKPPEATLQVVGYVDSGDGLEALVVSVNGDSSRPDGSVYHITWSLEGSYKPVDSNQLIKTTTIVDVNPITINAAPFVYER